MSIAISLVSLAESSLLELVGGPGLPIGPKLNKAFMTQTVSVAPQRVCLFQEQIHLKDASAFTVTVLLIFWGNRLRVLLFTFQGF